jgi:hypothetical protein
MWLIVFLHFIIWFILDLEFDFPLFHNIIFLDFDFFLDFFGSNLCTNEYITIEIFSFNVYGSYS